jgi:hypothetical protein
MSLLPILAALALLPAAEPEKPAPLRYLRPEMGKFVLESEVTVTRGDGGTVYVSRTERPNEKMTLTLRLDGDGRLRSAEALREAANKRRAVLTLRGGKRGDLKRDGTTDFYDDLPPDPVVTTAPDWSDIFQLVRRYDAAKGGKQEFAGLWIHPVEAMRRLTFTVERLKTDPVTVKDPTTKKDEELKLERYQVKLRSGDYLVWADPSGRVVKLMGAGPKGTPVVLEGFEEATRALGP